MSDEPFDPGRREFLRNAGRGLAALLLGGGLVSLVTRNGEKCINQGLCRGCRVFEDCYLPQALSTKEALQGQSFPGGSSAPGTRDDR